MSQGLLAIANGSGAAFRAAVNAALARLSTMASGTARPSDIATGEMWRETDNPGGGVHSIWLYDGTSDCLVGTLNTTTHVFNIASAGFDGLLGGTQGMVAYRGPSAWAGLSPGSDAFKALFSGGAAANPTFAGTWKVLGSATPSAAPTVDFTGIPASVHFLVLVFELLPVTNANGLGLQTYDAGGSLDSGPSDYLSQYLVTSSVPSAVAAASASSTALLTNTGNPISNNASSGGISGFVEFHNIQALRYTRGNHMVFYGPDTASSIFIGMSGHLVRQEADRITGVRLVMQSGNLTGRVILFGASN